ncbi:MAG: OsmC family protein [Bacteroidetes bacterium]|nr:OsmC family protein [Bacteroidota bacterium]MBS1591682.1 OsmC family protein [Bacteroidota bacterium]
MKATAKWVSKLAFDVTSDNNHTARLDTTVEGGSLDSGMSPKQMLLASLCSCSGMDVVSILEKMKVSFSNLIIEAEAEQTTEQPKVFTFVNMVYKANIAAIDLDKFKRAVELSHDKYCGVSIMLKKHCAINYTVEII